MPNIEDYWFRYKSACEIEGQKLEYISKPALIQLIAEIISLPVEPPVSQATCETLQKRFDIYAKAINDIDDFFEYRYKNLSNEQIKEIVMNFIDTISLKLSKLSG